MNTELKIPDVGESIQEVQIGQWLKQEGDPITQDENLVELETDKATMELPAPVSGILKTILKRAGEAVAVGETIAYLQAGTDASQETKATQQADPSPPIREPDNGQKQAGPVRATPSGRKALSEHGLTAAEVKPAGKRIRREDVERHIANRASSSDPRRDSTGNDRRHGNSDSAAETSESIDRTEPLTELEKRVPMSLIRRRIAQRLVEAQHQAALLTTFNEIDMSAVKELRGRHQQRFQEQYGIKLGMMSFFVKAAIDALKHFPQLNAEIQGTDILYRNYYHIGVAIGSERGLVVPVLRHAERMSFAEIEQAIAELATRVQQGDIHPQELQGGTFTISNGGIYGSLLSTPIVNPPQSGVLGMHAIQERPIAYQGQVVIHPMMYVALTYDHRIVDGTESVNFLKRVKEAIEEPARMLVEI